MSAADPAATPPTSSSLPWGLLSPPVHEGRFWIVQAGVLTLAIVHDVVLVVFHADELGGVPAPTTSALLLIPVMYAALNFGVRGGIGTAMWATVLIIPHWFLTHEFSAAHVSIEIGYLLVLNAVAVVVGQRVEKEQGARQRAETALGAARAAEARYYTLFEDQPAAVLITDDSGVVLESNTAASRLLGAPDPGDDVSGLLGVGVGALLAGHRSPLTLADPDGREVLLIPTAHRLSSADGAVMVQIVLSDITEQHRRQEEQQMFAGRLLNVQEEERRRLARELHDDPLQHLTFLTRTLDDLSQRSFGTERVGGHLSRAAEVADEAAIALRKIIQGLRPPVLDDLGLVSALRQLTYETRSRTAAAVSLEVTGEPVRLPPDLELAAYRIAQEALSNVVRHAGATSAVVWLAFTHDELVLTVTDDGVGIGAVDSEVGALRRLGLIGMRERTNMAGGTLEVTPVRPHGTRVQAALHLDGASTHRA